MCDAQTFPENCALGEPWGTLDFSDVFELDGEFYDVADPVGGGVLGVGEHLRMNVLELGRFDTMVSKRIWTKTSKTVRVKTRRFETLVSETSENQAFQNPGYLKQDVFKPVLRNVPVLECPVSERPGVNFVRKAQFLDVLKPVFLKLTKFISFKVSRYR